MEYFYRKSKEIKIRHLNKVIKAVQITKAYYENEPFDGDNLEDIAAFKRGEFTMVSIHIQVQALGLEGTESLGMCCYRIEADIIATAEEYSLAAVATDDWKNQVNHILKAFKSRKK